MISVVDKSRPTQSIFRYDLFVGKVALVTGGGTGIGLAIATELASTGCTVIIASRDEEKCKASADHVNKILRRPELSREGKLIAGPSTSLRNENEVVDLISFVVDKFGRLDFLINNAGGQFVSAAEDMSKKVCMSSLPFSDIFILSSNIFSQPIDFHVLFLPGATGIRSCRRDKFDWNIFNV